MQIKLTADPRLIALLYPPYFTRGDHANRGAKIMIAPAVPAVAMARAAIGWGVRELAAAAGVTANTVTRIEKGADAKQSTIDALKSALETAGVIFLADGETVDGGPGVRLRT